MEENQQDKEQYLMNAKQKYLRENIIDEGYDPGEFCDYLLSQKDQGNDINKWEILELIQQVQNFKKQLGLDEQNQENLNMPSNKETNQLYKSLRVNRKSKSNMEIYPPVQNIIIKSREKNNFILQVEPGNYEIKRNKDDITWLKSYLHVEFPFYVIPPSNSVSFNTSYVEKFLEKVTDKEQFKTSKILNIFVDDEKFSQIKEKKMPFLNDFMLNKINTIFSRGINQEMLKQNEEMYNDYFNVVIGTYKDNCDDHEYYKAIFDNLSKFSQFKRIFYDKLTNLSETLNQTLKTAGEILQKISYTYEQLQKEEDKVMANLKFIKPSEINQTRNKLNIGTDFWANFFLGMSVTITENMSEFFRYKKHEEDEVSGLLKQRMANIQETELRMNQLDQKKEKLFQQKQINAWQIDPSITDFYDYITDFDRIKLLMLPDETSIIQQINHQALFINKHVLYEYFNSIKDEEFYIRKNFCQMSRKIEKGFRSENILWNIFTSENVDYMKKDYTFTMKAN